jgi:NitT/TauT family transport system substrate-binding protein
MRFARPSRLTAVLLTAVMALAATACGGDDDAADSTQAPSEQPAATTAGGPGATDSGGGTTAAPSPSGGIEYSFAQGSPGLVKAFIEEAMERVEQKTGNKGKFVELADSDLVVQGAAEGQFDIASSTTSAVMKVIQAGAPLKFVSETSRNQWTLMAKSGIASCADIDGKRLGLHSPGGVSTALYRAWYKRTCNGEKPVEIFIEGSPARLQAMEADQLDVAMIELEDTLAMPSDQYTMLANFTTELADIKTGLVYANNDFATEHRDIVQAFVTELSAVQNEVMADPATFVKIVQKWGIETAADPEAVANAYIKQGMLPIDGGMTRDDLVSSIALYEEAGVIDPGLTPEDVADFSYVEALPG